MSIDENTTFFSLCGFGEGGIALANEFLEKIGTLDVANLQLVVNNSQNKTSSMDTACNNT
jgi:hypothetical protein